MRRIALERARADVTASERVGVRIEVPRGYVEKAKGAERDVRQFYIYICETIKSFEKLSASSDISYEYCIKFVRGKSKSCYNSNLRIC